MATDRIHVTAQGECFDVISYNLWGSEHGCGKLIAANMDFADVLVFSAGTRLSVPEAPSSPVSKTLPPWM